MRNLYESLVETGQLKNEDESPSIFGVEFYLEVYQDLSTTRPGGFGISPIPWSSIKDYCAFYGLEHSVIELVIRKIDNLFLEYLNGKEDNKN